MNAQLRAYCHRGTKIMGWKEAQQCLIYVHVLLFFLFWHISCSRMPLPPEHTGQRLYTKNLKKELTSFLITAYEKIQSLCSNLEAIFKTFCPPLLTGVLEDQRSFWDSFICISFRQCNWIGPFVRSSTFLLFHFHTPSITQKCSRYKHFGTSRCALQIIHCLKTYLLTFCHKKNKNRLYSKPLIQAPALNYAENVPLSASRSGDHTAQPARMESKNGVLNSLCWLKSKQRI